MSTSGLAESGTTGAEGRGSDGAVATAASFDVQAIRRDFPVLDQEVDGRPLVYLDSAASSQKPRQVIDAVAEYYLRDHANVHRGVHELARRATEAYEGARARVARWLGAGDPSELVWTRGTTEALNLAAASVGQARVGDGDEVVVSEMEHHSNIVPWQLLAARSGAKLRYAALTDDGLLDLDLASLLGGVRGCGIGPGDAPRSSPRSPELGGQPPHHNPRHVEVVALDEGGHAVQDRGASGIATVPVGNVPT